MYREYEMILRRAKKSRRFITCAICGKTITKKSMVSHFFKIHGGVI